MHLLAPLPLLHHGTFAELVMLLRLRGKTAFSDAEKVELMEEHNKNMTNWATSNKKKSEPVKVYKRTYETIMDRLHDEHTGILSLPHGAFRTAGARLAFSF